MESWKGINDGVNRVHRNTGYIGEVNNGDNMNTKHKSDCKMVFGKKDATCPRCQELIAGAAPQGEIMKTPEQILDEAIEQMRKFLN